MSKLSSIIPIRTTDFNFYRRRLDIRRTMDLSSIETIVVDDGSDANNASEIEWYCKAYGFKYVRIESNDLPFSLSRARNIGIDSVTSDWIVMEDADIVYSKNFYVQIAAEVDLIALTPFNFLSIPVIYLKEEISERIFSNGEIETSIPLLLTAFQFENPRGADGNKIVESYAPATALFVVKKSTLLHVGAYDELFEGWGGEDRDLAFRLLAFNGNLMKPDEFSVTKTWNLNETVEFKGWRSLYRLTGDYLANKGFYGFHLHHEKLQWRENGGGKLNIDFAKDKAISFYSRKKFFPRINKFFPVQVVVGFNPHLVNSQVFENLINPVVVDDAVNQDIDFVVEKIYSYNPESVIFWNPYGSEWRLRLYKKLRSDGVNLIVAERGALPNSFYFDKEGLCIESEAYKKFDSSLNLTCEQSDSVQDYIWNLRYGDSALEKQTSRVAIGTLRLKLNIPSDKKILFVPLQLSTDTVTNFFIEPGRTYADYLFEIRRLAQVLPNDWVMVIKNHPLALEKYEVPGVLNSDIFHINDLIEASSAVCLFNSGVGLISMAFSKYVFYYGKCFYAINGVNSRFESARQVTELLKNNFITIDKKMVEKFYFFLLERFYSFGKVSHVFLSGSKDKEKIKFENIEFKILRIPGFTESIAFDSAKLSENSILMGRFRMFLDNRPVVINPGVAKKSVSASSPPALPAKVPVRTTEKANAQLKVESKDAVILSFAAYKIYRSISMPFLSRAQLRKLDEKPSLFFADSKSVVSRMFRGLILR